MRSTIALATIFLLGGTSVHAQPEDQFLYSAPVSIEQAGWVRLALDASALAHGTQKEDWRLFGPDGKPVPITILRPVKGTLPARTLAVTESAEGWRILFDLGPTPVTHRSINIEPKDKVTASGSVLEGSPDRETWTELARADLFWLGEGAELRHSRMEYDPDDARYLRLSWPSSAGFPELRKVNVEATPDPPGGTVTIPVTRKRLFESPRSTEYLLELPGAELPLWQIDLSFEGTGLAGYRLFNAGWQKWELRKEEERRFSGPPETVSIDLKERVLHSGAFRLTLYPGEGTDATLISASAAVPPLWLLFKATETGEYTLSYGAWKIPAGAGPGPNPTGVTEPVMAIFPGPATYRSPPAIPAQLTTPQEMDEKVWAGAEWDILAEAPAPASWIHLEISEAVYEKTDGEFRGLRVAVEKRLVPFIHWTDPVPAPMIRERGLAPVQKGIPGTGHIEIDLPPASRFLTQLEIFSRDGPFSKRFSVDFTKDLRPGVEARPLFRGGTNGWNCGEEKILPCRYSLEPTLRETPRKLNIRFQDFDKNSNETFDLIGWRERHHLVFPWPAEGEVQLLTGFEKNSRPFPDLENLRPRILAMPWTSARLDLEAAAAKEGSTQKLFNRYLIVALLLVGVVLVGILLRSILKREGASD